MLISKGIKSLPIFYQPSISSRSAVAFASGWNIGISSFFHGKNGEIFSHLPNLAAGMQLLFGSGQFKRLLFENFQLRSCSFHLLQFMIKAMHTPQNPVHLDLLTAAHQRYMMYTNAQQRSTAHVSQHAQTIV